MWGVTDALMPSILRPLFLLPFFHLQLARSLVNMHNAVAGGDYSYVEALRQLPGPNAMAACQRDQVRVAALHAG